MVLEHGFDRVAQERGVVPRQRCHDQHGGLSFELAQGGLVVAEALEATQFTERLVDLNALVDRDVHAVDVNGAQAKLGLDIVLAQAVHQVVAGGNTLGKRAVTKGRQAVAVGLGRRLSHISERLHQGTLRFVELVEHGEFTF